MKLTQLRIDGPHVRGRGVGTGLVFDGYPEQPGPRRARDGLAARKSYLVQYRLQGEKRRMALGSCSAISLADPARVAATDDHGATSPRAATQRASARQCAPREAAQGRA